MSVVQTASIFCDGPGDTGSGCPQWAGEATTTQGGATAARRQAQRQGWVRRDGRDLCPECQERLSP